MSRLIRYFAQGCLVLLPVAATAYVIYFVVTAVDSLLGLSIPGLGLAITLLLVIGVGFFVSNVVGRRLYDFFDRVMSHLPVAKLLYTAIRDLIQAFVGEERRFGRPVAVRLVPGSELKLLGFVSRSSVPALGLFDHVVVYVPQAYNIAGQVLVVPASQVEPLDVPPAELLAFLLSGGASGFSTTGAPPSVYPS